MGCTDSQQWDRPHRGGCNKQQGETSYSTAIFILLSFQLATYSIAQSSFVQSAMITKLAAYIPNPSLLTDTYTRAGPTPHQWILPLPLYRSNGPNCSGLLNTSGAHCNGDIIQAPVDFASLSDQYAAFAESFIKNATADAEG